MIKVNSSISLIAVATLLWTQHAIAIDLQPGEIRAPKPGVNLFLATYQHSERGDYYLHGDKQAGDPEIQSTQYQVRLGRSFEVAEHPAFLYAQTPMGYVHPEGQLSPLEGDAGVGDTTFLLALWPYANHQTQTYLAVGAYFTIPTGSYDHARSFNMGANRYNAALQAGFQSPVVGQLSWMAAVDAVWFGDNDEYGVARNTLEQKALYTAQAGLRYDISPRYSIAAAYFYTAGGETSVNDHYRDDFIQLQRYQLSALANFAFGRITVQYGNDLKTENGFIEDSRLLVRYSILF